MTAIASTNRAIASEIGDCGPEAYNLRQMASELTADETVSSSSSHPAVRAVQTLALPAYTRTGRVITVTGVGALTAGMFDQTPPVAGMRVALSLGASLSDNGIYNITVVGDGATQAVLTMAPDWNNGFVNNGDTFSVQSNANAGSLYGNSSWKVFNDLAGTSLVVPVVVGTTGIALYPKNYRQSVLLAAGTYTIGLASTATPDEALFMLPGATVSLTRTTAVPGAGNLTVQYQVATKTPGQGAVTGGLYTGAVLTVQAAIAAGTINNVDLSTLDVTVTNW